ncbi:MAG: hypothetical protein WC560_06170 [Syntrophales bacterium]
MGSIPTPVSMIDSKEPQLRATERFFDNGGGTSPVVRFFLVFFMMEREK